ncbi:hypothetical protein BU23DRAFT_370860, partial [Bimuria novae-zelandiae CBS 107.79]
IRLLYNAGTPIYTKEIIRDVDEQLKLLTSIPQASKRCQQRVTVQGLDKSQVEFEVESGLTLPGGSTIPGGELDLEMVVREPFISYIPIQRLTSIIENQIPRLAYCSLQIHHYMDCWNKFSQEPVDQSCSQPYEEVNAFFRSIRGTWEASEACRQLRSTLLSVQTPYRKVVGLGLGTMGYSDEGSRRAAYQHALLLTLQEVLWEKEKKSIVECSGQSGGGIIYAQDPGYTPVDELILGEHGITVVGNPKGFLEVDDWTAVVSCAPSVPVKQIIADLAQPGIMIVDRICEEDSKIPMLDPDSPRVRQQVNNSYNMFEFCGEYEHFGEAVMYVRRH